MLVDQVKTIDKNLALAVAKGYFKLLAYKDEYEVARLHTKHLKEMLSKEFDKYPKISFYLAPPLLSRKNKSGKIIKKQFGHWFFFVLKLLAKAKVLRGTVFDVFSYSSERKNEVNLISQYETDLKKFLPLSNLANRDLLEELALLPMDIKGFGYVKEKSMQEASKKRDEIITALGSTPIPHLHAAE
jgi:indolepyruvate ferredoxin oxidoreductase